ncbi:MAG: catalase, partial [Thermoleophilaceae bacterium]
MDTLAEEAVDAINAISGVHPGHRAAHAKGTLLTGSFTPSAEASRLTTAAHMRGEPSRVTARFSNGGGDPGIPDYAREGRGMAVKLYLPDGNKTDIVG